MPKVGIDGNNPLDENGGIAPQIAPALVAATGTRCVRLNFVLGPFASPDVGGWRAAYRGLVDGLTNAGVEVYGLVGAEIMPRGHQGLFRNPADSTAGTAWIEEYVHRFQDITQHFADKVVAFESINEPNDWQGGTQAAFHPRWFAQVLARIYQDVKSPGVTLVSGPLLTHDDPAPGDDGIDYLRSTYQFGHQQAGWGHIRADTGSSPFDGVGLHIYVCQGIDRDAAAVRESFQHRLNRFAQAIDTIEGVSGSKPIYVSEFGWLSNINGQDVESVQALKIDAAFEVLLDDPRVALGSLFCMQDFPGDTRGIYRAGALTDAAKKLAFSRFQAIAMSDTPGRSTRTTAAHQFTQGFAAFAANHPEVGSPIEDQWYKEAPSGKTFAFQGTTTGLLIWSKEHNEVRFTQF